MPSTPKEREQRALKSTTKTSGGNTKPDAAWLLEVADELHAPIEGERPAGFLYQVNYQWEGYADELNLDFFESFRRNKRPEARKCNGTAYVRDQTGMYVVDAEWNRLTRPCLSNPGRGTVVCHAHGSQIPQVKAAAERVLAQASEIVALRLVGLTDKAEDEKVRLAAMNSVLDRAGIKGGVTVEVTAPGYKKVLERMFGAEDDDE
jgi:hypothetical protein